MLLFAAVPAHAAGVDQVFGKIDLAFEKNEGQVDPTVKFLARSQGYSLFLTDREAVMSIGSPKSSLVRMKLLGRQRNVQIEALDGLAGTTNYLLGNGSSQRTKIPSYKKVRYSEVYPGIALEQHR